MCAHSHSHTHAQCSTLYPTSSCSSSTSHSHCLLCALCKHMCPHTHVDPPYLPNLQPSSFLPCTDTHRTAGHPGSPSQVPFCSCVCVSMCAHTHTHVHTCTLHVQLAGGQAWQVASPRESPCVEGRAPKVCLVELWLPNRSATKSPVTPGNSCWHVLLEPRAVLLSPPFPFHSFGSLFLSCVFLAGFCFPP